MEDGHEASGDAQVLRAQLHRLEVEIVEQEHRLASVILNCWKFRESKDTALIAASRRAVAWVLVKLVFLGGAAAGGIFLPYCSLVNQIEDIALHQAEVDLYRRDLDAALAEIRRTDATDRYSMFSSLAERANVDSVKRFPLEFMQLEVYEKRYGGSDSDEKIGRFLQMYQYYLYLVYCAEYRQGDGISVDYDRWITSLLGYTEFLDVHCTHGQFYPKLYQWINVVDPRWRERGSDYEACPQPRQEPVAGHP